MGVSASACHIKPSQIRSRGSRIRSAVTVGPVRTTRRKSVRDVLFITPKAGGIRSSRFNTHTQEGAAFPPGSKEPGLHAEDTMKSVIDEIQIAGKTCDDEFGIKAVQKFGTRFFYKTGDKFELSVWGQIQHPYSTIRFVMRFSESQGYRRWI